MIELRVLGTLDVRGPDGRELLPLLRQPKRTALLVYLACAQPRGFHRRDRLLSLFWPEADDTHARDALNTALRYLRHMLGADAIVSRGGEEVGVDSERLRCDAAAFQDALEQGRTENALALYRGNLLEGFHVSDAPGFEEWLEGERARLRTRAAEGARTLADRIAERDPAGAIELARLAVRLAPDDERTRRRLIELLAAGGDAAGALRVYEEFAVWLRDEFGAEPSEATRQAVSRVRRPVVGSVREPSPVAVRDTRPIATGSAIGDAAPTDSSPPSALVATAAVPRPAGRDALATPWRGRRLRAAATRWVLVPLAAVAMVAILARALVPRPIVQESELALPDSAPVTFTDASPLAVAYEAITISPDGERVVYVARRRPSTLLYIRELDDRETRPVEGTEGAYNPFFSPDGEWIAFFANGLLKKVGARGGPPAVVSTVQEPTGGTWLSTGRILVADRQGYRLSSVPSDGGELEPIERRSHPRMIFPKDVGDGRWILHGCTDNLIYFHSLENGWPYVLTRRGIVRRDSADPRDLVRGQSPRLLPKGRLLYFTGDGVLQVATIDLAERRLLRPAVPVLAGVRRDILGGVAQMAVSTTGALVYALGEGSRRSVFVWVEHGTGRVDTLPIPAGEWGSFSLSPRKDRVLARLEPPTGRAEVWVFDAVRGAGNRLVSEGVPNWWPRWTPDGEHAVVPEYPRDGVSGAVLVRHWLSEPGRRDTVERSPVRSMDGRWLVTAQSHGLYLKTASRPDSGRLIATGDVGFQKFSPDGRWLAYTDMALGRSEVYIAPTEGMLARIKVSEHGGEEPLWTPDSRSVIYREHDTWWAVDVWASPVPRAGRPRLLFRGRYRQVPGPSHDIAADGRRQLLLLGPPGDSATRLVLVRNWFARLDSIERATGSGEGPRGPTSTRRDVVLPDSAPLVFVGAAPVGAARVALTLSPDGRRLAYVARNGESSRLVVRPLDGEPVPVSGTEGAYLPFFSPDGEWVAFFTGRELRKVSAHGGPALSLAQVHMPSGGAWSDDGRIVVADVEGRRLFRVPATGGAPEAILPHPPFRVLNPEIVSGTDWLLHGTVDAVIGLHSLSTGRCLAVTRTRAVRRDSVETDSTIYGRNPRWLPTGHIAYFAGNGVLTLLPFDPATQSVRGPSVPVLEGIRQEHEGGAGQLAIARNGTVAYVQGDAGHASTFVWVDHATGAEDTLALPRADYNSFRLSPDGRHILVQVETAASRGEVWVLDIDRGVRTPIRTGRMPVGWQAWWPDGRYVLIHEDRRVGASSDPVVRYSLDDGHPRDTLSPHSWPSPDGRHLVVFEDGALWLRLVAAGAPRRLLARGNVKFFSFSPDGSWLLYTDMSTGDFETYAVPTSGPVARVKISAGGGEEAVWSADGGLIVYRNDREWWGVDVSIDGHRLRAGRPRLLFRGPYLQVPGWSHDIARDGRRQLLLRGSHEDAARRIVVVTNWFDEVNRRMP